MEKLEAGLVAKTDFNERPVELGGIGGFTLPRVRGVTGKFRLFGHYIHVQFMLLALAELALIITVSAAIYNYFIIASIEGAQNSVLESGAKIALMAVVFVFFMVAMGLYDTRQRERLSGLVLRLIAALFLAAMAMSVLYRFVPSLSLADGLLKASALASVVSLALIRALFYKFIDGRVLLRRVLVVGAGKNALFIDRLRRKADMRGFHLVGFVEQDSNQASLVDQSRILKFDKSLCAYALANDIDEIVLALDDRRQSLPTDDLLNCRMSGIDITDTLDFFERESALIQLDLVQPSWLIHSGGFKRNFIRTSFKRSFDILVSVSLLVLSTPFMLLTALAILLDSGGKGPIFYSQQRVGRNGQCFNVHKFRSMKTDAEADGVARWAQKEDPRVTRVGSFIRKYRLDELPQLWNVLAGDMSLVGPRPERPEFVKELCQANPLYKERHRVCPGITGWAQLCYPYGASAEDSMSKLQYDLYYVKNHGLFLDAYTLIQTVEVVLFKKGSR
ncbi:MAG: TIGR03013 family PEP-CTERM/XrtA system glycosyltransferase [Gammaproteobacteria bacterium]|nr:TIGR03013 family PEP-CTERM/XrtA system glycosyltransferase [Gammaproteobacteria bacterium]MBQ0838617.1 TIGR03013 family PEP-CTERM/XrtA system glycosyltransferase [Gammaproteobacteria bacterium]